MKLCSVPMQECLLYQSGNQAALAELPSASRINPLYSEQQDEWKKRVHSSMTQKCYSIAQILSMCPRAAIDQLCFLIPGFYLPMYKL